MLFKIPLICTYLFCVLYPLCLWINTRDLIKHKFHHFQLGLPCVLGFLATVGIFNFRVSTEIQLVSFSPVTKYYTVAWIFTLLLVTALSWNKTSLSPAFASFPSVIGLIGFWNLQYDLIGFSVPMTITNLLSGAVLTLALYGMNLGHFYLNVHGLPLKYLRQATYVFWAFCGLRLLWNLFQLASAQIFYDYTQIYLHQFLFTTDGFLLILAILFGTIFPLVSLYFVKGTLDAKSTQSATGILYVIVSAVLLGELTYKYYLFKFLVAL